MGEISKKQVPGRESSARLGSVRALGVSDIDSICRIASYSFYKQLKISDYEHFLNHTDAFNLGLFDQSVLMGYFIALVSDECLDVISIATDIRFRRSGVSERLLRLAFSRAPANRVTLEVEENNEPAKALYYKLGFRVLGTRKAYYDGLRDAYRMGKTL